MAGKKAKSRKTTKKIDFENLKPSDVLCPICRTILIEPVTLSCNHAFCKLCFEGTMENANLVCPLCRVRVGSWFRRTKKEGKLVDEKLWDAIQKQYPTELQNRYQGIDNDMEADVPVIVVATPGEIRKEYELHRQRELEEQEKITEAEEKASAPLIQRLRDEEELRKKEEEEKLRLDAALARKLAEDLTKPSTSKFTPKKIIETKKFDSSKKYGPMDKFIKTEETKSNRPSLNKSEERKKLCKSERKRISITPHISNFATKEYTCHVLNAESHPKVTVNPYSIFNKRASYNKASYSGGLSVVQKKIRQAPKIVKTSGRKSMCKSGYKSSGSGSDDAIDQECKIYFKPIDTQRRHHLPGTVPLKVPSLRGRQPDSVDIGPPTGKIINLQLGTVISAFARFSMVLQKQKPPSNEVIEDETSDQYIPSHKKLKRKMPEEDSPAKKKGKQIYSKKNFQYIDRGKAAGSPLYGFDNESSRIVNSSPFYGFDTLVIKESNRERDTIKKLVARQEQNVINDNKAVVISTATFYKSFKTYSRNHNSNRHFKESKSAGVNTKLTEEEPLKLQISKTLKNGINMSAAIKKKLAELRGSIDAPSEIRNKIYQHTIDVNRNIPKITLIQPRRNSLQGGAVIRSSIDTNSRTNKRTIANCQDRSFKDSLVEYKKPSNSEKFQPKSLKFVSEDLDSSEIIRLGIGDDRRSESSLQNVNTSVKMNLRINALRDKSRMEDIVVNGMDDDDDNNSKIKTSPRRARTCRNVNTDSKTSIVGSKLTDSKTNSRTLESSITNSTPVNSGLNGCWKTRQSNGSPRKTNLNKKNTNSRIIVSADPLVVNRVADSIPTAVASTDCHLTSESIKLDDSSTHCVNKTYQAKTRNVDMLNTNSKITDTFSKIKNSPTKPTNAIKKLKSSPTKTKLNNNIELDDGSVRENGDIDFERRRVQERADFEMARLLQAEFDAIQVPSRTRRGTKRQITLDEMLSVV